MIRIIYTLLFYLALPWVLLRLYIKGRTQVAYRHHWLQRISCGYLPMEGASIWLHAVSLGESLAAIPLIKALQVRYPTINIVVTTTTPTGREQIKKHLAATVRCVYLPLDVPLILMRFIKHFDIKLCIIMERELWPNVLHVCHKRHIPVVLANARLSESATISYLKVAAFSKSMCQNLTRVIAQSHDVRKRFIRLGVDSTRAEVAGNLKFDMRVPAHVIAAGCAFKQMLHGRPVLIAASTRPGEEEILLQAFALLQQTVPDMLLIIVPRHSQRCIAVKKLCEAANLSVLRRSEHTAIREDTHVYLVDTMGELLLFYATADIAFVGGSLVAMGGHNMLEPAALGKPILTGPYLDNFLEVSDLLQDAKAMFIITDAISLAEKVHLLLLDDELYQSMQENSARVMLNNTGSLAKHLATIGEFEEVFLTV